jgi:5'-deoxynucleotidase YfbR-like HD superfamily hydrolase
MKLFQDSNRILAGQIRETELPEELCPVLNKLDYPRRGWLKRNVNESGTVETALQHTAKLALAAAAINPRKWGISDLELRRQCLIHEIPEILGTDWTPGEISDLQKSRLEADQMRRILPSNFPQRQEIIRLWYCFEGKGLAYALDKMDAAVTAEYYALVDDKYKQFTAEFHQYACRKIQDETLSEVLETVRLAASSAESRMLPGDLFPYYFDRLKKC